MHINIIIKIFVNYYNNYISMAILQFFSENKVELGLITRWSGKEFRWSTGPSTQGWYRFHGPSAFRTGSCGKKWHHTRCSFSNGLLGFIIFWRRRNFIRHPLPTLPRSLGWSTGSQHCLRSSLPRDKVLQCKLLGQGPSVTVRSPISWKSLIDALVGGHRPT